MTTMTNNHNDDGDDDGPLLEGPLPSMFFFFFLYFFYFTYNHLQMLQMTWWRWCSMGTLKSHCMMSLGLYVCFYFRFFFCFVTNPFYRYYTRSHHPFFLTTTTIRTTTWNDGRKVMQRGKTPKRRHTTSLGHLVCYFFCSFISSYLPTTF